MPSALPTREQSATIRAKPVAPQRVVAVLFLSPSVPFGVTRRPLSAAGIAWHLLHHILAGFARRLALADDLGDALGTGRFPIALA